MYWYPVRVEMLQAARERGYKTLHHPRGLGLGDPVWKDGDRLIFDSPHTAFIYTTEWEWISFVTGWKA